MKLYIDHRIKRVRESRRLSRTRFCMTKKGMFVLFIFAFNLPRGTCSSHRSDRETLSQLSFMP
nr:MAG TPA: hypothetical protein [Caudoviricetes sp.]